jgi:hypothetical protein
MPSNEALRREYDDHVAQEETKIMNIQIAWRPPTAKPELTAEQRYELEIKPVLEARRRIAAGLPTTDNRWRNWWLKITGQDKIEELPESEIVDPTDSFAHIGPSEADVVKEIVENPDKFQHLARKPEKVKPVKAVRKTPEDFHR